METHLCSELILFWKDYTTFKNNNDKELAISMYKKYIMVNAINEINISAKVRLKIQNAIEEQDITPTLFDDCSNECKELIEKNIWRRFKEEINELMEVSMNIINDKHREIAIIANPKNVPKLDIVRINSLSEILVSKQAMLTNKTI